MSGARRTEAERAIIYAGVLGEMPLETINKMLASVGARDLVQSSFDSIRKSYVPHFKMDLGQLGDAIKHPPTWGEL